MSVAIATGRKSQGSTDEDGGDSAGISFAIPLGTVESVVKQLLQYGEVSRGMLGIRFYPEPARIEDTTGFRGAGVKVEEVTAGGPAYKAGLRDGDIITVVDGEAAGEPSQLRSIISSRRPGQEIKFKAWQNSEFKEFVATLAERPREDLLTEGGRGAMERFGVIFERSRPMIRFVVPDSAAADAGLERGQLIKKVGETSVDTSRAACLALAEQGLLLGRKIPLTIVTEDESTTSEAKTIQIQLLH